MIVDIAIVFTILGCVVYVVLITRVGTARKQKNALTNLAKLYHLYHNQSRRQAATVHQPNQSLENSLPKE